MCTSTQQLKRISPWQISQMTENCDGYKICSQIIWFFSLLGIKLNSPRFPSGSCSEWLDSNEQKWGYGCDAAETRSKDHYSFLLALSLGSHTHSGMSPATSGKQLSTPLLRPIMEKPRPPANSCAREPSLIWVF